tara:strand:+ start:340 stop:1272 length:933 start_codon:yes stop_codon:yes gene_type:complete
MKKNCEAPVLLIAFNRPSTTREVFESIRKVKPKKLYVAVDGPRQDKLGEAELCKQVIDITKKVDWDCETKYLIRDKNLGCKYGVSGAISWALNHEDRVIIIEDDIVAVPSFFNYAEVLLEKYKDDDRIAMISGNNYTPLDNLEADYTFSQHAGHIWGWATWRRTWKRFDVEVPELPKEVMSNLESMHFGSNAERRFYKRYFRKLGHRIKMKTENTWDSQFSFFLHQNNLLAVVPKSNLCSNVGETSSRTSAVANTSDIYYPADENFILKKHPTIVEQNLEYDLKHFKKHINAKSFLEKAIYKIKKELNIR